MKYIPLMTKETPSTFCKTVNHWLMAEYRGPDNQMNLDIL